MPFKKGNNKKVLDMNYIKTEYINGNSSNYIANKLKVSPGTIRCRLREMNIVVKVRTSWNKDLTKETNPILKKISEKSTGRELSKEHREKVIKNLIPNEHPFKKGHPCYYDFTGKKQSEETRKKLSIAKKDIPLSIEHRKQLSYARIKGLEQGRIKKYFGKEHWNWLGGRSFEPYGLDFNKEFKNLVRLRDNFCCQLCGMSEQKALILFNKRLVIHHIDYDKLNTCLVNCISLCTSCHAKTNSNRNEWREFYQEKLKEKYNYLYQEKKEEITNDTKF